jgi:hypothetical protein
VSDLSTPSGQLLWQGRPLSRPGRADLLAGVATLLVTAAALSGGLVVGHGAPLARAAGLGLGYAAVVSLTLTAARVAGVNALVALLAAFFVPVTLAAAIGERGLVTLCPGLLAAALVGIVIARLRQRLATRFWLTTTGATTGEAGKYLITWPVKAPPSIVRDRFGGDVVDVDFGPVEARLATRDGKTFVLPARPRRFERVSAVGLEEALSKARAPG